VKFTEMIKAMGYNTDNLRLVPQQWSYSISFLVGLIIE
jgi:hypothetical protein